MAPRKSDASKVATGDEATPVKEKDGVNVEDLSLPRSMVQRLAKGVLPPNTQIQKDAVLAMSKGATVFVNYLSSHANENALRQNKKTIMPKDVIEALKELEFDDFLPRLEAELAKYTEIQTEKRNTYRKKGTDKAAANGAAEVHAADASESVGVDPAGQDEPPAAKKARRSTLDTGDSNGTLLDAPEQERVGGSADDTVTEEDEEQDSHSEEETEDDLDGAEQAREEPAEEDALELLEENGVGDDDAEDESDSD
ncbi:MAG: hypothetical protein M1833_007142 [Piccolia ochrophora]|nr:MAG: hypothetical protein M1833_007142 [Piccolia ochrophora]